MPSFEYECISFEVDEAETYISHVLNEWGADGWEIVGITPSTNWKSNTTCDLFRVLMKREIPECQMCGRYVNDHADHCGIAHLERENGNKV